MHRSHGVVTTVTLTILIILLCLNFALSASTGPAVAGPPPDPCASLRLQVLQKDVIIKRLQSQLAQYDFESAFNTLVTEGGRTCGQGQTFNAQTLACDKIESPSQPKETK